MNKLVQKIIICLFLILVSTCLTKDITIDQENQIQNNPFIKLQEVFKRKNLKFISTSIYKNLNYVGLGYDIYNGNPFSNSDDAGIKTGRKIFDIEENDKPYGVSIFNSDNIQIFSEELISKTTTDLKKTIASELGIKGNIMGAEFSLNTDFKNVLEELKTNSNTVYTVTAKCSVYKAEISDGEIPNFNNVFKDMVANIANYSYKENQIGYFKFLEAVGTHYIKKITFGSRYSFTSKISNESLRVLNQKKVDISSTLNYLASVNANAKFNNTTTDIIDNAKNFTKLTKTIIGSPYLGDTDQLPGIWQTNTKINPMPIKIELALLTDLLDDPINDKKNIAKLGLNNPIKESNFINGLKNAKEEYCTEYLIKRKQYNIVCKENNNLLEKYTDITNVQEPNAFLEWLPFHNISCDNNSALNLFKMISDHNNNVNFMYKCLKSEKINSCTKNQTKTADLTQSHQLNEIQMVCPDDQVLSQFQFYLNNLNAYFKYTCCKADVVHCNDRKTESTFDLVSIMKNPGILSGNEEYVFQNLGFYQDKNDTWGRIYFKYRSCQIIKNDKK